MLDVTESLTQLAAAHPFLENARLILADEWCPDDAPPTVVSSSMAKTLIPVVGGLSDQELSAITACIEKILGEADERAKDVVATGFLEAVVAAADEGREGASLLMASFGPKASAYCQEWTSFTDGR